MRSIVLVSLAALLAPAVAVAQDDATEAPPPPPEEVAEAAAESPPPPATPEWLTPVSGGLTADRAAQLAVETAPSVRGARAAREAAQAQADQALSQFAPRFDFTGSYSRINEVDLPQFEIPGLPPTDNPFPQILDLFSVQGTVAVPVSDYFLTVWPSYEGADGFTRAAQHQIEADRQQVAFRAREAFFNHVRARGSAWVAQQTVESVEATQRDVENLLAAGVGSRADVAQVRAQLASARAAVVQARGQVRVSERLLRRLMHLEPGATIEIGEDLSEAEPEEPPEEEALVSQALDERAELLAIREVVSAREAVVRARVGGTLPRVALTGSATTASPNQRVVPQTTDIYTTWVVGASVTWSPNDLAVGIHQVRQAEAEVSQAREDLAELEDAVAIEAAQALAAYEAAREGVVAAREGYAAASLSLDDRRAMLRAGAATTTEVTQAQLALTQAQLRLLNAIVDLRVAGAQIDRVVGRSYVGPQ